MKCAYCAFLLCLYTHSLSPQTSIMKCRFQDKIIKNFKTATAEHSSSAGSLFAQDPVQHYKLRAMKPSRSTANRTACICAPQDTLEDIYSIIISGGPKLEITQTSTNIKWTMAGYTVCISCVYMCVYIYVLIYIHKIKYYIVIKIKEW